MSQLKLKGESSLGDPELHQPSALTTRHLGLLALMGTWEVSNLTVILAQMAKVDKSTPVAIHTNPQSCTCNSALIFGGVTDNPIAVTEVGVH